MLPVNCGSHTDYQHFVVTNLRKYYPDPDALARSTWDIMEKVEDPLFIKMTLRLIKMVFLFVLLDAVCVVMVLKSLKAE